MAKRNYKILFFLAALMPIGLEAFGFDLLELAAYLPLFCPLYFLTELHCPTCGLGRALVAVYEGEFHQAFELNPLVFALPLILVVLIKAPLAQLPKRTRVLVAYGSIAFLLVFGSLRTPPPGVGLTLKQLFDAPLAAN